MSRSTRNPAARALATAIALALGLPAGAALAQQSGESVTLEEVVVTAQKREQKLLDVPMSITALTGDALAKQGATTLLDLAATVPGMSTLEYAPGQNRVQLRGISAGVGAPTVGLYLDELPINIDSVQGGSDVRFIDLERVEVLRGPQGTLYGEGSMGGTIKYVTRNPDLEHATFGFDGAIGSVKDGGELYRGNVVANVPVVDGTFGLRFVGGYEQSPGWVDYPLMDAKDVNEGTSKTARLKGLWKVSDNFRASLLLAYQDSDYDSMVMADETRTAPYVVLQPSHNEERDVNLVLDYDAGAFSVLSSTGYLKRDFYARYDVTGFFAPIYYFVFGFPVGSVDSVVLDGTSEYEAWSEELRFASKGTGPLQWTAGLYYRDYKETADSSSKTTPNPLPVEVLVASYDRTSKQFAAFGEATWSFNEKFDTTLGLRYFSDKRDKVGVGANFGYPAPEPKGEATFTSVDPKLVFSYRPADGALYYASAAKGFRSGGFNLIATRPPGCDLPEDYEPEDLWTYELGANLSFSDGRVIVQGAVYHNEWKNIQVYVFCPGGQTTQVDNVGKASGTGFDLQVTLRPVDALTLSLSAGYNDSKYDESSASHNEGDRVDYASRFGGAAAADWSFHWSQDFGGRFHLDYQYTDEFSIALRNYPGSAPISFSDPYGRLNARLSVLSGLWEFSLFGQNLTDTNKMVMPPIGVLLVPVSMQPRTIGVGVRYNY